MPRSCKSSGICSCRVSDWALFSRFAEDEVGADEVGELPGSAVGVAAYPDGSGIGRSVLRHFPGVLWDFPGWIGGWIAGRLQAMRILFAVSLMAVVAPASFAVKLANRDSSSHDILLKCSTTTHTSIGASSTRDVGNGPCTVTVKKTGSSATASGDATLTIKDGKVSAGK